MRCGWRSVPKIDCKHFSLMFAVYIFKECARVTELISNKHAIYMVEVCGHFCPPYRGELYT